MTPPALTLAAAALAAALTPADAGAGTPPRQDAVALARTAESFVLRETQGLPGRVSVQVGALDTRLVLSRCAAPEPFLPPGTRLWGNAAVGVRCAAPLPWTVFIPVQVRVEGPVLTAARPLAAGHPLAATDLVMLESDLTRLPAGVVTELRDAVGKVTTTALAAGQPLRSGLLRAPRVLQQGQTVKVLAKGPGFSVSAEGRALSHATDGQVVQARVSGGQVVSGIARQGGIVEVTY